MSASTPLLLLPSFMFARVVALSVSCAGGLWAGTVASAPALVNFQSKIEPILSKYCYDCHGGGLSKGNVTLDEFSPQKNPLGQHGLWLGVLKNTRAGLMPPLEEGVARPTGEELETLARWIKHEAFGIDPNDPDPGHVTARRLNRVEYRNTIKDLMGIDFNSEVEFPPDDSGGGFDNNGDVLTISPLLLEKYLAAAEAIVERAVPKVSRMVRERVATGRDFKPETGAGTGDQLNARRAVKVSRAFQVDQADRYRVVIELEARGSFDFDPSRCRLVGRINGEERFVEEIAWSERRTIRHEFEAFWQPGRQEVSFEVVPLSPAAGGEGPAQPVRTGGAQGQTSVTMRVSSVTVRGPLSPQHWMVPENHPRFFPTGAAPEEAGARDRHAVEVLRRFATRAFRRPVEESGLKRLVEMARQVYSEPGRTFEEGIGRAMMAVLGSPRFLFRIETAEQPVTPGARSAQLDEWALASRLSYFLWSTMPDEELFRLVERGELRRNLGAQVARMLRDPKAQSFTRNFTGQWLQARDIEFVPINMRMVMGPDAPRNKEGRIEFDSTFRRYMRSETEMYFEHLIREDRSVLELIDSDYTFLNERLAAHYGVPGVTGENLRRVQLPPDSPRGGILTQGTVLAVTSNPTRTSPVKRGLFILDNILGVPPPPPPAGTPDLEEAKKEFKGREPKLSEMLALHRADKLCHSCHVRMDPLGLALENFNAMGAWRETEAGQPIEPAGVLVTGEKFSDVRELKRVMARDRKTDIYRCLTEKLMTYALGRAVEYHDAHTVDQVVGRLEREGGRMSALLMGVIESPAFQRQRVAPAGLTLTQAPAGGGDLNQ